MQCIRTYDVFMSIQYNTVACIVHLNHGGGPIEREQAHFDRNFERKKIGPFAIHATIP